jgi:hypothetical protein
VAKGNETCWTGYAIEDLDIFANLDIFARPDPKAPTWHSFFQCPCPSYATDCLGFFASLAECLKRVTVTYLDRKWLAPRVIHSNIIATLRPSILGYRIVTRYFREAKFLLLTEDASDAGDRKPTDDPDEATLSAFNESPFVPVRQLSRFIHLPLTTL